MEGDSEAKYLHALDTWCGANEGSAEAEATALGQAFLARGAAPDEILELHKATVEKVVRPNDLRGLVAAQHFLLEVMIAYGRGHSERSDALVAQAEAAAERERERALAAEQATAERIELLANISHELGTPLTLIQGNLAILRKFDRPTELLPGEIAVRQADVDSAVARMVALREQLVAANREEIELELVPLLVDRQVEQAIRWAEPAAMKKRLNVRFNPGCDGALVAGDEQALQSILGNLLSNAIRYTPGGGTITVSTFCDASTATVEVSDTGIGLSDEAKQHLFERFYRSREAKSMATFGLGLGLSLTKGLVEAMEGTIAAESSPAGGSSFRVVFRRLEPADLG